MLLITAHSEDLSALVCSLTVEEGKAMFAILPMADLQVDAWGYMVK